MLGNGPNQWVSVAGKKVEGGCTGVKVVGAEKEQQSTSVVLLQFFFFLHTRVNTGETC